VFYAYIDNAGVVQNMNEVTAVQNWEGYPSMAVDPVSGKPIYAWHANADNTTDAEYEIQMAWDAFLDGIAGLISDPTIIADNPITTTSPSGTTTTDNEFLWPTVQIGPSPNAGMRRVYVLSRNTTTHTAGPSENAYIVYADFNEEIIETGGTLTWNVITIPEMDNWNVDSVVWRRPFHAFTVGNDGRLYYAGYHFATDATDTTIDVVEEDMDVFVCGNYGQGTWERITAYSNLPTWNPPTSNGTGPGYFVDDADVPFADEDMYWSISNSAHINSTMDAAGNVHVAALWAMANTGGTYWPAFQTVKEFVYNPDAETFQINEIYPVAGTATDELYWKPWDEDADGTVDEYDTSSGDPLLATTWPFCYWDDTVHDNAMMFHYNNIKMSTPNEENMIVAVWEDALRARYYNLYPTDFPELAPYANTPEIYIACSPDNGGTWSDPIVINNVETTQFAGMKPMWVYPADKVKYVSSTPDGHKIGKVAIMFYDDVTWGAAAITPPVGQNDGGTVKFMELEVTFPLSQGSDDHQVTPNVSMLSQNYPNPFNPETRISFNMPKSGNANLNVYNTKGQLVKTLINGNVASGAHELTWNGTDNSGNNVASGLYFYKLSANGKVETRKMMLMK
jgi:hypothetical protein